MKNIRERLSDALIAIEENDHDDLCPYCKGQPYPLWHDVVVLLKHLDKMITYLWDLPMDEEINALIDAAHKEIGVPHATEIEPAMHIAIQNIWTLTAGANEPNEPNYSVKELRKDLHKALQLINDRLPDIDCIDCEGRKTSGCHYGCPCVTCGGTGKMKA